jgi:hypothetical protein
MTRIGSARVATVVTTALLLSGGLAGTALAGGRAGDVARCTGDTISTTVVLNGPAGSHAIARLLAGHDQGHMVDTGQHLDVVLTGRPTSYPLAFDIAGRVDKMYRVDVTGAAGGRRTSASVPAASCAPGTEVPEAPAAVLVPLSMIGMLGLVSARRRLAVRA